MERAKRLAAQTDTFRDTYTLETQRCIESQSLPGSQCICIEMRTYLRQLRRSRVMRTYLRQLRRSRVMRRSRVIFDRQRPSVVDLRCPPAAVGRSEALCTNRPYSVDLRSALKQTRRSRVVLGASQICADLGSCGTAAPGNADFGSSPVSMRRFRGSPSAGAEQRRSGVSFARRADLGSFLRICADPGLIPRPCIK